MLKLNFTKEQIEQLRDERFHHPHPRVQRKMEALLLKSKGLPNAAIAELVGIAHNTLLPCFHQFQEGGVAARNIPAPLCGPCEVLLVPDSNRSRATGRYIPARRLC